MNILKRLSLPKKIHLALSFVALIGATTGIAWYLSVSYVDGSYSHFAKVSQGKLDEIRAMYRAQLRMRSAVLFIALRSNNAEANREAQKMVPEEIGAFEQAAKNFRKYELHPDELSAFKGVMDNWSRFKVLSANIREMAAGSASASAISELIATKLYPICQSSAGDIDTLIDFNEADGYGHLKQAEEFAVLASGLAIAVPIGVFVVSFALGLLFAVSLRRSTDSVVRSLADTSEFISTASLQVAQSAEKLAEATSEQSSSLQQTSASAQELTKMVQRNMESAERASSMTTESQEAARKGQRVVQDMTDAIREINKSNDDIINEVNESNRQIAAITRVIAEIGEKTKVINDIVFQTKLLSFNASVEAARAGDHGKGFAVVAEEVGNLARMSGSAAKEITDMLDDSIRRVDNIVRDSRTNIERLVKTGKDKVDSGTKIAFECGRVLEEIVGSVSQVNQMSLDISAASGEQAIGVREISRAFTMLDRVADANTAAAEQAANAADQMAEHAKKMKATVHDLLAIVNGMASQKQGIGSVAADGERVEKVRQALLKVVPGAASAHSSKSAVHSSGAPQDLKAAAGSDLAMKAKDDPRFEDI